MGNPSWLERDYLSSHRGKGTDFGELGYNHGQRCLPPVLTMLETISLALATPIAVVE
jgi:hypothetical protein